MKRFSVILAVLVVMLSVFSINVGALSNEVVSVEEFDVSFEKDFLLNLLEEQMSVNTYSRSIGEEENAPLVVTQKVKEVEYSNGDVETSYVNTALALTDANGRAIYYIPGDLSANGSVLNLFFTHRVYYTTKFDSSGGGHVDGVRVDKVVTVIGQNLSASVATIRHGYTIINGFGGDVDIADYITVTNTTTNVPYTYYSIRPGFYQYDGPNNPIISGAEVTVNGQSTSVMVYVQPKF